MGFLTTRFNVQHVRRCYLPFATWYSSRSMFTSTFPWEKKPLSLCHLLITSCDCYFKVWLYQLQQYPDKDRAPYKNPAKGCERYDTKCILKKYLCLKQKCEHIPLKNQIVYKTPNSIKRKLVKMILSIFRAYVVQVIPGSNLVLVVVDSLCPQDELAPPLRPAPVPVERNHSLACERASMRPLPRHGLKPCINSHPNVSQTNMLYNESFTK